MATLDLRAQTKPTDGRQESYHALDVGTTYALVYLPPRRLIRSVSIIGNDGAFIWKVGATEGGAPDANDRKVPANTDDQVLALDAIDISPRRPPPIGVASASGTVSCNIAILWR